MTLQNSCFYVHFVFHRPRSSAVIRHICSKRRNTKDNKKCILCTSIASLWLLIFNSRKGKHMSAKITDYDKLLVDRVEAYRERLGFTQDGFAETIGISKEKYLRNVNLKQKPYAETMAMFSVNLGVSLDEIMLGKNDEYQKIINYIRTCPMKQLAEILKALSDRCMQMPTPVHKTKKYDYVTEDGNLVEVLRKSTEESGK